MTKHRESIDRELGMTVIRKIIKNNRHRAIEAGLHGQLVSRLLDTGLPLNIIRRLRNDFYGE